MYEGRGGGGFFFEGVVGGIQIGSGGSGSGGVLCD